MVVLETKRLRLRTFSMSDALAMEAVFCDPDVMRYSDGILAPNHVSSLVARIIEHDYPEWGFGMWAIVRKTTNEVAGYCGFSREQGRCANDEGELGYRLARSYWGCGYAFEAASAVCRYGFRELRLNRIVSTIDPHNQASIRIAEKLGMCRQGEIMFLGYDHPDLLYVLD